MSFNKARSSTDYKRGEKGEPFDLEALEESEPRSSLLDPPSKQPLSAPQDPSLLRRFLSYPAPGSLRLRSTSWLDGVRGMAAFGVYLFHAGGVWMNIVEAWHATPEDNSPLQLPFIRTIFVSGGSAVSVFFTVSGYVLTQRSLRMMREGARQQVYPAVASSMFRRGFRLYIPPILLTFCELLSTIFGYAPPLNFDFKPEPTFFKQFLHWVWDTNLFVNPYYNMKRALQGLVTHGQYDPVLWTLPLEFYGSFVCYFLLLGLARVPSSKVRMNIIALAAGISMVLGSWNTFCFLSGMLLADYNLGQDETDSPTKHQNIYWTLFVIAFYIAGFPTLLNNAKLRPMPGFQDLLSLSPFSLAMEDHARWWWSLSGVSIVVCTSQLPRLKAVFETDFVQYLGKISFALYLIHEFCLMLVGLKMQELMLALTGVAQRSFTPAYWVLYIIWFVLFTVPCFALAAQVERWVDAPSVTFAKWLEGKCLRLTKGTI